jgi:iron complex outermembrane receptor protein
VTSVPISITVADAGQLERQQVRTVEDLARIAPSLEIKPHRPGTGGGGEIRGIGTQTFAQGAVASVGIVVDQVSQGNANISSLFDIARVEVLKGPQGTLFGLTTSAGVINITTNKPDMTKFSARLHADLSNAGTAGSGFGNQVIQGVVNLPLAANAALRVSGSTNLRQGPNQNTVDGKYIQNNSYSGRAHLLWEPTSKLTANFIADYTYFTQTDEGDFFTLISTDASTAAAWPAAASLRPRATRNSA